MSNKNNGIENSPSAKVLKLGFNISVSGDSGTDFEIVLDDKEKRGLESSLQNEEQHKPLAILEAGDFNTDLPNHEAEKVESLNEIQFTGAIPKDRKSLKNSNSLELLKISESESGGSCSKDTGLINKIKSTIEQFEKFSDHIKEIPRLKNCPLASSTPFSDKYNSRSDSSLVYPEFKTKKYSRLNNFHARKEYFKCTGKPSPPDLFLKPLPAEGYYKRGIHTRYFDFEPYRHYGLENTLNKTSEYRNICLRSSYDSDKYEESYVPSEPLSGILKKSDSENGDKQSTSSADSIKDIKIYQSGGILIMQNFKDNMGATEKKEISEFSAKLIENCNKLRMEVISFQEDQPTIVNSSDENKNIGKMVQFDLSSVEGQKSKSGDLSSNALKDESSGRIESSESTSDCMKSKDASPPGTSQSQDFPSLSTQDNDSILSNQPGMSPTCTTLKKLEWDSGADIGYLNLDLTKENLSTIEKIVLKGLSGDGVSDKSVFYEKNQTQSSKYILERKADLAAKEIMSRGERKLNDVDRPVKSFTEPKIEMIKVKSETGEQIKAEEIFKEKNRLKFEETEHARSENSFREISPTSKNEILFTEKLETSDKSVNVNTLFQNANQETPPVQRLTIQPTESPVKPKHRKLLKMSLSKNKKSSSQRLLRAPKKSVSATAANSPSVALGIFEMGVPKKAYKKVEANPTINEVELSREVDEIIIDQRFKIKTGKESEAAIKDQIGDNKEIKSRPISASSGSNNTVLPTCENKENIEEEKTKGSQLRLTDQIIQTGDYDCHSVGVQAFASQISSDCDLRSLRKNEVTRQSNKECANTSSKNIQAFGLNASLPKQLENSKETEIYDKQHTKSTQFFGGPLSSLPNYHSHLATKSAEAYGKAPNILKAKRNSETEKIRLREENEKNILANDAPKLVKLKNDSVRLSTYENKENLITQKSTNSKRNQSNASQKDSKKCDSGKKKNSPSMEGSNHHILDEVSNMSLTSEVLREHGLSIDRNIIKEKYFQSQLVELEKRKMISRSTSMEIELQLERGKNVVCTTTGCQYSPQSKGTTSGGHYQEPDDGSFKDGISISRSRQNLAEENFETSKGTDRVLHLEIGDSLPSSTQTAHSWIPGMRNFREDVTGVGRARSFEYLPAGHIYESSGNLREELPSETEKNLITSSSDSDTAKGSSSEDSARNSKGRNTLILENSTENSLDSDRLKILDENLAQLNFAVLKLREKDAQVQTVTQSLLANLWKKMGSGDSLALGATSTSKTVPKKSKDSTDKGNEANTLSEISTQELKKDTKEFSVACQTEPKTQSSESEKFFEQRKTLEKRISEEKKCQIKWIENEIHHLNILRELLEKQNSSVQKKKKHSVLTISLDDEKNQKNRSKNIPIEIHSQAVTPVYGCTISISEKSNSASEKNHTSVREQESQPQYGMAVSLSGKSENWQRLVMLPLDLQVSLKDNNLIKNNTNYDANKNIQSDSHRENYSKSTERNGVRDKQIHFDMCTQYPTPKSVSEKVLASSQAEFPSSKRFTQCNQDNCLCINLSENSSVSVSCSSRNKSIEEKNPMKLRFQNEELDPENTNKPNITLSPKIFDATCHPVCQLDSKNTRKSGDERSDKSENYQCRSVQNGHCKCQKVGCKSDSPRSKRISIQSINCNCQNFPNQLPTSFNKSGVTCRGLSQSNIHLSCDKVSAGCRCSKIQVQKSSNCACHIIKIHGSRCASESNSSSCRRPNLTKKMENQSCQTDCESVQKLLETIEAKTSKRESEASASNKLSCDVEPTGKELPKFLPDCICKRKTDDHPRHYFLRIEETEVDELIKPAEPKKSLEVITVTIPVKKAGKGKLFNFDIPQTFDQGNSFPNFPPKSCNCCEKCTGKYETSPQDCEHGLSSSLSRNTAEKPESPTKKLGFLKLQGSTPSDCSKEQLRELSYSQQFSQDISNDGFEPQKLDNHVFQCCEKCRCFHRSTSSREIQKEYDSHKRRKNVKENYDDGNWFWEDRKKHEEQGKMSGYNGRQYEALGTDSNSESRHFRNKQFNKETSLCNSEYYNYNKREFMTKSEIRKEEEQKRKVHQPSLQEYLCSNRPDFYSSAERRREIISERSKDRLKKKNNRMECLMKMLQQCNEKEQYSKTEPNRIFTTLQMREQTLKRYKKLPEVTEKIADQKKKEEYRTNRLMADVFAKKLQIEALKGHINLSNSVSILNTI